MQAHSGAQEVELKLACSKQGLDRIRRAAVVRAAARGRPRTSTLIAIYFDTPALDLRARRIALRVRREGRHWVQTLKTEGARIAGLYSRGEHSWRVSGPAADAEVLEASEFGGLFSRRRIRGRLAPVFTTEFVRRTLPIEFGAGTRAQLCLDLGALKTAGAGPRRTEPICEAEVELVSGSSADLIDFAACLLQEAPLRLAHASKAERGYALLAGAARQPRKAVAVRLDDSASAAPSLAVIVRGCRAQIEANEEGFLLERDPEYLHQLRVGFRRLRVALALPRDAAWRAALGSLKPELRWLSRVLGEARNWDVFATELLPALAGGVGAQAVGPLRRRVARRRSVAARAARAAVASVRYQMLGLNLAKLVLREEPVPPEPARAFGARALSHRYERLIEQGDPAAADADALHRARIEAKKLRYTAEFFVSLYPGRRARRFVEALEALQDVMGAINDAAVSRAIVEEASAGRRLLDPAVSGLARGWIAAGESSARKALQSAWGRFAAKDRFW